jgi:DNA-binding transcriptional LysR family regulator
MADLSEAELAVSQLHEEPKGDLRINAPMSFGTRYLSKRVAQFTTQYPDLRVQLTLDDRFVDPIEEGYDLNIRVSKPAESHSLINQVIAPMRYVLCASTRYLEQQGTPTHPTDLRHHSCLHYGYLSTGNQWRLIDTTNDSTEEHAIAIRGALCSNNGEVLCDAAIEGLGIALLPEFIVCDAIRNGELTLVLSNYGLPPIAINVIYPVNRHLSTKVKLFIEFLQSQFGPKPPWTTQ